MGLFFTLVFAALHCLFAVTSCTNDIRQTYIVRVQNDLKPSIFPNVEHWYSSTLQSLSSTTLSSEKPRTDFLHVYKTVFHGFSTKLTKFEAEEIKNRPGILDVFSDRVHHIQTTRSPHFLGLNNNNVFRKNLLSISDYGSNVVIGVLDTGIWPERRSFHDEGLGPIPAHWKGECTEGREFPKSLCNKKLVGARYFPEGYQATAGPINDTSDYLSARDSDGHGTHTASTAAGRHVKQATLLGFATGVAAGIAPKARIAVYKICWNKGCFDSDILAAFDKAVEDGVDVISISVGGAATPYNLDPIAVGAFGAMERGVLISAAAGNDGPGEMTVSNIAPWITTVGAGTIDRKFPADLVLEDGRVITGTSLYSGKPLPEKAFLPLVYAGNAPATVEKTDDFSAAVCMPNSLDPQLVRGKIVLCERGGIPRAAKGNVVREAGGAGMIITNVSPDGEGLIADAHLIPAVAITESAGYIVHGYIASSANPRASFVFRGTQLGVKPAPVVASFSSRGPNLESPYIIKPDLIAPGVNILAAWPDGVGPTGYSFDTRRTEFSIMSGTSMSCPHVSGLAALLKGAHPDWSPAKIRSALMTTAYVHDNKNQTLLDESTYNVSNVWDYGSGHVYPEKAVDPGLVYDLTVDDYLDFLCASNYTSWDIQTISRRPVNCTSKGMKPWDLNYPSISVLFEQSGSSKFEFVVTRTVTHIAEEGSSYTVTVKSPRGAVVTVDPPKLVFGKKGEKQSYVVRIAGVKRNLPPGNRKGAFGKLTWADGKHVVNTPIVVVWEQLYQDTNT